MSTPTEPELPWLQPTGELPAQPAGRRRIVVVLLPVLGLLVLCCGGSALVTAWFRGDLSSSSGKGAPTLVVPSSGLPSPADSPYPTPTLRPTSASASPSAKPTTHRPSPSSARPTTTKPSPSAPASSGIIQQDVRLGALCGPRGAIGLTKRGAVLHCGPSLDDPRNRWRTQVRVGPAPL